MTLPLTPRGSSHNRTIKYMICIAFSGSYFIKLFNALWYVQKYAPEILDI